MGGISLDRINVDMLDYIGWNLNRGLIWGDRGDKISECIVCVNFGNIIRIGDDSPLLQLPFNCPFGSR